MTLEELAAIKARCEAATPGPIVILTRGGTSFGYDIQPEAKYELAYSALRGMFGRLEDAEFYAHARDDVPALVAEVARLQHELEIAIEAGPENYDWDVLRRLARLEDVEEHVMRLEADNKQLESERDSYATALRDVESRMERIQHENAQLHMDLLNLNRRDPDA